MAKIVEPLRQKEKLTEIITKTNAKKVMIVFWHGLGDLIMFLSAYDVLREKFPKVYFYLAIQKGLGFEEILPNSKFITVEDMGKLDSFDVDLVAKIHFPVETNPQFTKGELCCKEELGIEPIARHKKLKDFPSRLIGIHYQNTAMPDVFNPSVAIAEKIWDDVLKAGFIPIELAFQHVFHNPKNAKFAFVDATVRRCIPRISTLIGLLNACCGTICAVSGPLHIALAYLPKRVLFLEKGLPINRFTRLPIPSVNVNDDKFKDGEVTKWLSTLQ